MIKDYAERALGQGWYEVRPAGWRDVFYFHFDPGILKVDAFVAGIPESLRTFATGRPAPNPAQVRKGRAFEDLRLRDLGAGYNQSPWYADSVHGRFPDPGGGLTAVGGVNTWGIVDPVHGPFKHLYTCFDARDPQREQRTGVPSGAGWHRIGDAAESLLNTLETESLLNTLETESLPFALARAHQKPDAAFGLTHAVTAAYLGEDEVAVTRQGEFHWYVNPYDRPVCTEVWVHKCVPNIGNNWGFNCN